MELIDSDTLPADDLDTEDVPVQSLGGAVRVRAMDLVERLSYERRMVAIRAAAESKEPAERDTAWLVMVPEILELCVIDKNGRPVKSAARWRKWGSKHSTEAVQLFNVAWRLSRMSGGDAEKN